MVKVKLPNVEKKRVKGRLYYYYRVKDAGRTQRIRLNGEPLSAEFMEHYHKLRDGSDKATAENPFSFNNLIENYLRSPMYAGLAERTRKDYFKVIEYLREKVGKKDVRQFRQHHVIAAMEKNSERARFANYIQQVMSILFQRAIQIGWIEVNPALRVPKLRGGEGYPPWTDEQLAKFRSGVSDDLVAFGVELALATGQRPSDVVGLRWSDYDGQGFTIIQRKTGKGRRENELYIPVKPEIAAIIETRRPARQTPFLIESEAGTPMSYDNFEKRFRKARKEAKVEGVSLHGLRKNAVRELLEAGCSDAEVMAITGHRSREMVTLYGRSVRQKQLARSAMDKRAAAKKNSG